MAWVVDKGVPVPEKGGRPRKYFWAELSVGDSVFIAGDQFKRASVRSSLFQFRRAHPGYAFKYRGVHEDGEEGIRVWRVSALPALKAVL